MTTIRKKYKTKEIAESLVITEEMSPAQKKKADAILREARKKVQEQMSEKDKLVSKILQFKFQIEDYLSNKNFNPNRTFGYFLKEYVHLLNKKRKNFAKEIDIDETELSQLINRHRLPNENIMIRLEIHSNNSISAVTWFKLIEKEKEHSIRTNKALRQQERQFVTNKLAVKIG
jgi:transcriptional regulator with XRE-family HTH domain